MTRELISKRTRINFREFLVGWTLREIAIEFDGAEIERDRSFESDVSGQRRSLVEQYYCTLDFTKPSDAKRLLAAYEGIVERAERTLPTGTEREGTEHAIERLKESLRRDGFVYLHGRITAENPKVFEVFEQPRSISKITRGAVLDDVTAQGTCWHGRLPEIDFLTRLYDLSKLPSYDSRRDDMLGDILQHREANLDWGDNWVFSDKRLDLTGTTDENFLRFLCEMVHPEVRPNRDESKALVAMFNKHLVCDGWEIAASKRISGRPTYVAGRTGSSAVAFPTSSHAADVLSTEYVRELSEKCDSRLSNDDLDGVVTSARTLLEAILAEIELRLGGLKEDYKGDLAKQFKHATKLLRMDDTRADLNENFKQVIRGLVMVVNGLAPLRNKMSDAHARERKPSLHHARLIVNAVKTMSAFLVESYIYQTDRRLIHDVPPQAERARP
jgi:hypothetical protein